MRLISIVLIPFLTLGCAHSGVFAATDHFSEERLFVRDDCTFSYEYWTDDGGLVICTESGEWLRAGALTMQTTVTERSGAGCPRLDAVELWQMRWGRWRRNGSLPFRRTSLEDLAAGVFGRSSNPSSQRTRSTDRGSRCLKGEAVRR